jgi:hypothetical protein
MSDWIETALSRSSPGSIDSVQRQEVRRAVAEVLARLLLVLPRRDEIGPATAVAYSEALDDLHPEDLAEAFRSVARLEEWFPPPVIIRRCAEAASVKRLKRQEQVRVALVGRAIMAEKQAHLELTRKHA